MLWNTSVTHNNNEALGECLFALHYTGRSTHKKLQVERQTARNPKPSAPQKLGSTEQISTHIYIYTVLYKVQVQLFAIYISYLSGLGSFGSMT